jgi:DNA-binding response OmpR family regulator
VDARVVIAGRKDHRPVLWTAALAEAGFNVTALELGQDLLRLLDVLEPEAILLDMDMLGRISALELCRSLRLRSDAVIIMVSHRPDDMEECVALGVGADHYLSEKRDASVVIGNLSALVRRRRGGLLPAGLTPLDGTPERQRDHQHPAMAPAFGEHRLTDGAIEVDVEQRTVLVADVPTVLTRTEFDLLVILLRNPRRVFSHEQLMQAVGLETTNSNHPLRVHLSRLRNKIVDAGGGDIAHNVHGVGYRLRP